ncbi:MAG: chromosome partitioning protein ParB, partial [Pseudolabrys sp.]|nr:chromosome partitioning protein ParB [Pseudolabrys sp.]
MPYLREPLLKPVAIADLRPTQMTVGLREVKNKRKELRRRGRKNMRRFLGAHMVPVVLGPDERYYVVDHHHLALALHGEGLRDVLVTVMADLSMVGMDEFWTVLDHHGWVYPYDSLGRRKDFKKLPKTVSGLKDDPFRSLAGELRRVGGFAKNTTPFSEFLWADFFRRRVKRSLVQ